MTHIVTRHHTYLRRELPRIVELTQKVAAGDAEDEPRLEEIATIVTSLASVLLSRLMDDHEATGAALARVRELTDDYTAPEWACNTTRAVYHSLGELERDIHQHVHKENKCSFRG